MQSASLSRDGSANVKLENEGGYMRSREGFPRTRGLYLGNIMTSVVEKS